MTSDHSPLFRQYKQHYAHTLPDIVSSPPLLWPSRTLLKCKLLREKAFNPWPLFFSPDSTQPLFFSPDSRRLVAVTEDGSFQMWDSDSGVSMDPGGTQDSKLSLNSFAFSADSRYFVTGSEHGALYIWNALNGRKIKELQAIDEMIQTVSFSPTENLFVSDGNNFGPLQFWKAPAGEAVGSPISCKGWVAVSVFSPDGTRIATVSWIVDAINIWDRATGNHLGSYELPGLVEWNRLIFSPSGEYLAVSGGFHMAIVNGHTAKEVAKWTSKQNLYAAIFTPEDRHFIWTENETILHARTLHNNEDVVVHNFSGFKILQVSLSPTDDTIVAAAAWGDFLFLDAISLEKVPIVFPPPPGRTETFVISPDWSKVAVNHGNSIYLYDVTTEEYGKAKYFIPPQDYYDILEFSPSGDVVLSACDGNALRIWDADTAEVIGSPMVEEGARITCASFLIDGRNIASGSTNGVIRLWDSRTGESHSHSFIGHSGSITGLSFSPDGHCIASTSEDATIRVWTLTGQPVGSPFSGSKDSRVAFTFDSKSIIFNKGRRNGYDVVEIWHIDPHELMGTGNAPENYGRLYVFNFAFSPDGRRVACVCGDREESSCARYIDIWPVQAEMAPPMRIKLFHQPFLRGLSDWGGPRTLFSSDSAYLICHKYIWDLTSLVPNLWKGRTPPSFLNQDPNIDSPLSWAEDNWVCMIGSGYRLVQIPKIFDVTSMSPYHTKGNKVAIFLEPSGLIIIDCSRLMK